MQDSPLKGVTVTIRTKDDVARCYHDVCRRHDCDCPHVNVKVRGRLEDVRFPLDDVPAGLTVEWIRANIGDEQLDSIFWRTCESEWEMLQQDAEEIFGAGVEVQAGGRSGGWACVTGLADIADWDAVMLAKWRKFARYARQLADGVFEQMVYSIQANEWEQAEAKAQEDAGVHRDPVELVA
jgi:hypothetical protein